MWHDLFHERDTDRQTKTGTDRAHSMSNLFSQVACTFTDTRVNAHKPTTHTRESWGGGVYNTIQYKNRVTPPSPWHPQPLIGFPVVREERSRRKVECVWGGSVFAAVWTDAASRLDQGNKTSNSHRSFGRSVHLFFFLESWKTVFLFASWRAVRFLHFLFFFCLLFAHGWRGAGRRPQTPLRSHLSEVCFGEVSPKHRSGATSCELNALSESGVVRCEDCGGGGRGRNSVE